MNIKVSELARYRLTKSKDNLKASILLYDNDMLSESLNRSYYAIFHATRAVLATENFDSKKHSGIIAFFNANYIKTGVFDKMLSKILMGAERIRNKSDYNDFYVVSRQDAKEQIENAKIYIAVMEQYIEQLLLM
ncbi:MAG: HEPN domain-containing protein [Alkaliphilus sp.]